MKGILFIILGLCLIANVSFAQKAPKEPEKYIKAGQHILSASDLSLGLQFGQQYSPSGQFRPWGGTQPHYNQLRLGAKLGYGYMLSDRWMIGGRLGYHGTGRWEKGGNPLSMNHQLSANAFSRYYLSRGKWSTYVEGGVGISAATSTNLNPLEFIDYSSIFQELKLGLQYHINDRVSLDVSNAIRHTRHVGLNSGAPDPNHNVKMRSLQFFNPSLGINIRL
ncbi:MAG: acyloxyacyl hydrolase [Bacteroidota bacterium]